MRVELSVPIAMLRVAIMMGTLGLAAAFPAAWGQSRGLDPEELYERIAPSVWVVVTDVGDGKFKQGSAVVIAPETLITNCHVLEKAKAIVVFHGDSKVKARLQYKDPSRDLCQLDAPGLVGPPVRMVSAASLRVGAKVYAIGNPRGLELTMSDGLLSALRRGPDGALEAIQISVPISPGSSGGGLFDAYGRLIGITTFGVREAQNLNFALPADWVVQLPVRAGGVAVAVLDPPQVIASAPREPLQAPVTTPAPAAAATAPTPPASNYTPIPAPSTVAAAPAPVQAPPPEPQLPRAPVVEVPAIQAPTAPAPIAPEPPRVAMAIAAPPRTAVVSPAAVLKAGMEFEYRLTDRLTGHARTVLYRIDQVQDSRVVFNDGSRIESLRGEVLVQGTPMAGEWETVMPPGGWMKPDVKAGDRWALKYSTTAPQDRSSMDLQAHAVRSEQVQVSGYSVHALRIEFEGFTDRAITQPASSSGRYRATAWFSTELRRIVRFDVKSQGGSMSGKFVIDEILELVAVRVSSVSGSGR